MVWMPVPSCRDLLVAAMSIIATLAATQPLPFLSLSRGSDGRWKIRGEHAFVLIVGLTFQSRAAAEELLAEWTKIADYCYRNEPFLLQYEISESDKERLRYVIIERYRSKEDYLHLHRNSVAFREFRPKMKAMQDKGDVAVSGDSFRELGVGFT